MNFMRVTIQPSATVCYCSSFKLDIDYAVFVSRPPKKTMTDDVTGEPLIQRSDDNVETLRKRLASYHKQTAPVVDYYRAKGIWNPIDAAQAPNTVWESLLGVFGKKS